VCVRLHAAEQQEVVAGESDHLIEQGQDKAIAGQRLDPGGVVKLPEECLIFVKNKDDFSSCIGWRTRAARSDVSEECVRQSGAMVQCFVQCPVERLDETVRLCLQSRLKRLARLWILAGVFAGCGTTIADEELRPKTAVVLPLRRTLHHRWTPLPRSKFLRSPSTLERWTRKCRCK